MFTKAELIDAINELEGGKHSIQNCAKLAAIYTVLDHLYPEAESAKEELVGYSGASGRTDKTEQTIMEYGDTEFLNAIAGRSPSDIWLIMDELMSTLLVVNPRLYDGVMRKIFE